MVFGLPVAIIFLVVAWVLLTHLYVESNVSAIDSGHIRQEYEGLGRMGREERCVLIVFVSLALLWVFRKGLRIGSLGIPGWSEWLPYPDYVNDGVVAIGMALILFVIPSRRSDSGRVMD